MLHREFHFANGWCAILDVILPMLKIGLVGCGTIGSELARLIPARFSKHARVAYVCDSNSAALGALRKKIGYSPIALSLNELVRRSDFVIEAASQDAAVQVVSLANRLKKRAMVLSVGGLCRIPSSMLAKLKTYLHVPSGAVAGIDALLAGREGKLRRVTITTRKPLASLLQAPFFKKHPLAAKKIKKPTIIFEGSAKSAVSLFPQNINVAATVALAGVGFDRTKVCLIASPTFKRNTHEIVLEGNFGRIRTLAENVPSEHNPKTSALVIFSALACLAKVFSSVKVGT